MNQTKNKEEELKYFMYCRKSSEDSKERQAQSIESQLSELRGVRDRNKLKVVHEYTEEKSAHTTGREVFSEMMRALERGEANAILVWHANRLTRNMTDGAVIVALMDSGVIKEIKTPGRVYSSDSTDKFVIILEFGLSKKDSDDKSDVVKRGLKTKCEKGSMPGVAPIGYMNTPHLPGGSRVIIKDEDRFDVVKQAWLMMASGKYNIPQIHKILINELGLKTRQFKRQGNKPIALSRLYKMFRDSFYCGRFEYPRGSGNFYQGSHEPIIDKETFNIVQKIMDGKSVIRPKTKQFAYTGLMKCGNCKAQITAETKVKHQKNGNVHQYTYYRCTRHKKGIYCRDKPIKEEMLEKQIKSHLESIVIPPIFEKWAIKWLGILYDQELETAESLANTNEQKRVRLEKEMDSLFELYTSPENKENGFLTMIQFVEQKKRIQNQIDCLEDGALALEARAKTGLLKSKKDFNFATFALQLFENGTLPDKKSILAGLGYNLYISNQNLDITLKKPFEALSVNHNAIVNEMSVLEPINNEAGQEKTDTSMSAFPVVLRG